MILASLARYYRRLAAENDEMGNPKVPPYGFSEEKIGWILVLDKEGRLKTVVPNLTADKKPQPKLMNVPRPEKRTSGIKPNFLWDKTAYALGVEANKNKAEAKEKPFTSSEKTFDAFKQYHLDLLQNSDDEGLQALCRFLQNWQPAHFAAENLPAEMLDANIVFSLEKPTALIHKREAAQTLWAGCLKSDEALEGLCLISGDTAPIARLHPAIKGVFGGQSSGGSIISFNKEAFASFGKEQGANAPVSEQSAFAYTTALNYLLRRENNHCLTIGDASTVFWAEADDSATAQAAEGFFAHVFTPPDDEQESAKVFNVLKQISNKGRPLQEIAPELSPNTRFYILGLAPNAARISVRFWLDTTFGQLAKNLAQHWRDLALEPSGEPETRKGVRFERTVHVSAEKLGISGVLDLVEVETKTGRLKPVEYKRGKPKPDPMDEIQLCAQGLCLEEMTGQTVSEGALWYMQTRHRVPVVFSDDLRAQTHATIAAVRELLNSGKTPPPNYGKRCKACSLVEICQPELLGKRDRSVGYVEGLFGE